MKRTNPGKETSYGKNQSKVEPDKEKTSCGQTQTWKKPVMGGKNHDECKKYIKGWRPPLKFGDFELVLDLDVQ